MVAFGTSIVIPITRANDAAVGRVREDVGRRRANQVVLEQKINASCSIMHHDKGQMKNKLYISPSIQSMTQVFLFTSTCTAFRQISVGSLDASE